MKGTEGTPLGTHCPFPRSRPTSGCEAPKGQKGQKGQVIFERKAWMAKLICQRCGRKILVARKLTTGRTVCFWCYDDLPLDFATNFVIDDWGARSWEETKAERARLRAIKRGRT